MVLKPPPEHKGIWNGKIMYTRSSARQKAVQRGDGLVPLKGFAASHMDCKKAAFYQSGEF